MRVFVLVGLLQDEGEHILGVYASEEEAFNAQVHYLVNDEEHNVAFDTYVIEVRELDAPVRKSFETMPIVISPLRTQ